ncbi:MAG: DMT family transporter [Lachnospiraceae bacterium]|jgi:drug/metabolite transporter (DMT)-like permease|nr:DMT family transporter [Lachnospiraceae bacterium]
MSFALFTVLFGSFLFGLEPVMIKYLQTKGYSSFYIVFWLFLVSLVVYMFQAARKEHVKSSYSLRASMFLTGAVGMGFTTLLLTLSYHYIQTSTATLIHFTYPILVVVCMSVLFRQPFTKSKMAACILSLLGMLCITNFTFAGRLPGYLLAFLSAATYAFYDISNEKSRFAKLPPYTKMTFLSLGVVVLFGFLCLILQIPLLPVAPLDIFLTLTIGLMNCFGYMGIMHGLQVIGASKTAFAATMEPVASLILSILVYHDTFSPVSFLGILFVFLSMYAIMRQN